MELKDGHLICKVCSKKDAKVTNMESVKAYKQTDKGKDILQSSRKKLYEKRKIQRHANSKFKLR